MKLSNIYLGALLLVLIFFSVGISFFINGKMNFYPSIDKLPAIDTLLITREVIEDTTIHLDFKYIKANLPNGDIRIIPDSVNQVHLSSHVFEKKPFDLVKTYIVGDTLMIEDRFDDNLYSYYYKENLDSKKVEYKNGIGIGADLKIKIGVNSLEAIEVGPRTYVMVGSTLKTSPENPVGPRPLVFDDFTIKQYGESLISFFAEGNNLKVYHAGSTHHRHNINVSGSINKLTFEDQKGTLRAKQADIDSLIINSYNPGKKFDVFAQCNEYMELNIESIKLVKVLYKGTPTIKQNVKGNVFIAKAEEIAIR
ncbi:MAG: hypothetical protein AAFO07_18135 [Bacteroidota bacterium]